MGILNIHAALSAVFRRTENIIYCKVSLQSEWDDRNIWTKSFSGTLFKVSQGQYILLCSHKVSEAFIKKKKKTQWNKVKEERKKSTFGAQ